MKASRITCGKSIAIEPRLDSGGAREVYQDGDSSHGCFSLLQHNAWWLQQIQVMWMRKELGTGETKRAFGRQKAGF